jgi:signal transduction histidine kinase
LTLGRERISEMEMLDLNRVIEAELPIVRTLVSSRVRLQWDPGPPLWLKGARTEIRQLLLNLCANGRDAMPEGGNLRISTERAERATPDAGAPADFACLVVSDDGSGMDEETRRRLYEPFYTTKATKGTGLGMSVVLAAVEQHAGSIEIESTPGRGTTFSIFFPLAASPEATPSERAPSSREALFGTEHILVHFCPNHSRRTRCCARCGNS